LPLFLLIPDRPRPTREPIGAALREGFGALVATLKDAIRRRPLILYLIANVFIRDGIAALSAFGGIYAAGVLGWGQSELGVFGIVLIVTAAFGAWAGGRLDDRIGPLAVIVAALAGLIVCALTILSLDRDMVLFVVPVAPPAAGASLFTSLPSQLMLLVGALLGLFFGPILAAGRSLLVALSPPDRITAVFGLYAFAGKVTSFLAPLSVAILTDAFDSQRWGAAIIPFFLVAGLVLMLWVRRAAAAERRAAAAASRSAGAAAEPAGGSV
jgi:UMF1 family MFS transporter